LLIVDSIPYFLKKPFSCAITSGEQSVSAIIPNFSAFVSGPSVATVPGGTSTDTFALVLFALVAPHPTAADVEMAAAVARKARRVSREDAP